LEEGAGFGAAHEKFPHVRQIKEPHTLANGFMFGDFTLVAQGHAPSPKGQKRSSKRCV
jgi:hypothetical protein